MFGVLLAAVILSGLATVFSVIAFVNLLRMKDAQNAGCATTTSIPCTVATFILTLVALVLMFA